MLWLSIWQVITRHTSYTYLYFIVKRYKIDTSYTISSVFSIDRHKVVPQTSLSLDINTFNTQYVADKLQTSWIRKPWAPEWYKMKYENISYGKVNMLSKARSGKTSKFPHKWPVKLKMFPCDDIMECSPLKKTISYIFLLHGCAKCFPL